MQEKKAPGESYEAFADRLIRQAQERGEFANLPGLGKPIPGLESPRDENSWIKDKMKREQLNLLSPALQVKLEIERAWEELPHLNSEQQVRSLVESLNAKIREAHYALQPAPGAPLMPLNEAEVLARWRSVRA